MPTATFDGPTIPADAHNVLLRDALLHAPTARLASASDYYTIQVGVREGAFTDWIGTWNQATQKLDAATPVSVLDESRRPQRIKAGQVIVVKVTASGTPATIKGARVTFRLALVGGRAGDARPLVNAGGQVSEAAARTAIAAVEQQINTGGLAEWDESVALDDPVALVETGGFQGRIARNSATQIILERYVGNWIDIDGEPVGIGADGVTCDSTDPLLAASGGVTSTAPSADTLYYVYYGGPSRLLRLSATAPTRYLGAYYLGTTEGPRAWRFCGWVYLDSSTQINDSVTAREVVNYHNRRLAKLYTCPAYSDGDSSTTYTMASAQWAKLASGGTDTDVSFIANGEDAAGLYAQMIAQLDDAGVMGVGIGIDGVTAIETAAEMTVAATTDVELSTQQQYAPGAAGRHVASIVGRQATPTTATIYADRARNGAAADPAATYLLGWVLV